MKFACFGGAAAVADEELASARHQSRRRNRSGRFLFGGKDDRSPSKPSSPGAATKRITSPGRRDLYVYDMIAAAASAEKSSWSSSVPSSSALSTAASLDSACSSSSSSSCSSSRSSSYASLSSLDSTPAPQAPAKRRPQPDERQRSPALGVAAVLVCLVMLMFGGRFLATLLTAAVLCFFPRHCPPAYRPTAASTREAVDRKAVMDRFLARNRN